MEHVLLLHGIFLGSWQMRPLAAHLEREGYAVTNVNYPSTRHSISGLVEWLRGHIAPLYASGEIVHGVGFSMGGLLLRGLLSAYPLPNPRRFVMIGTPNGGSEVADFLKKRWLYRKLYGPAGQELGTGENRAALPAWTGGELGIIAGNRCLDPFSYWLLSGPHDGKVTVENTKLEGMKAHIVLPHSHTALPYAKDVHRQTGHFLRRGEFVEASARSR